MSRRIPERYTVMIARTDQEPIVFSVQPIAIWMLLSALITLTIISFFLGWILGRSIADRKTGLQLPSFGNPRTMSYQFPLDR